MTFDPFFKVFLIIFQLSTGRHSIRLEKMILGCKFQILGIKTTLGQHFAKNLSGLYSTYVLCSSPLRHLALLDLAWTNKQGQTDGYTAAPFSSRKGIVLDLVQSKREQHNMTKSPSILFPSFPHPDPHPLPALTTPPPIPSSPYLGIPSQHLLPPMT